jgi:cobalamin synthase
VSLIEGMGRRSLIWGTVSVVIALIVGRSDRGWIAWALAAVVTSAFGFYCRRRIAGITGDTLGSNLQLCESAALLTFVWTQSPL